MTDAGVRWRTFIADIVLLATGGLTLLLFLLAVSPKRRGFFCNDETIKYPFHQSTIPNYVLYIFGFSIPFSVIVITEIMSNRKVRTSGTFLFRPAPLWVLFLYRSIIDFLFGCVASQLITDVGKYTIGRLRPNFIAVCNPVSLPDRNPIKDCSAFNHTYILDYECAESKDDAVASRVSFPSGHSSFSAYTMLYIAIYVQVKVNVGRKTTLRLYKAGFQLGVILLAYFTALSRVMDNKHHWSDVLAGGLIGSITACIVAKYVSGLEKWLETSTEREFHDITNRGNTARGQQMSPSSDTLQAVRVSGSTREQSVNSSTRQNLDIHTA